MIKGPQGGTWLLFKDLILSVIQENGSQTVQTVLVFRKLEPNIYLFFALSCKQRAKYALNVDNE